MYIFWILVGVLVVAVVLFTIRFFLNFYKYNFKPRYFSGYAMEWYPEAHKRNWFSETPDYYYASFEKCIHHNAFDAENNIKVKIGNELYEHPAMTAEWSIIHYERYLTSGNEKDLSVFLVHANQLLADLNYDEKGAAVWYYQFDLGDEKAPFYSGISQGMGISALIRAYQHTQEDTYLKAAIAAYQWMIRPFKESGCLYHDEAYDCWFEEDTHGTHILNGHVFSLFGLYDLYRVTQDPEVLNYFERGCNSIIANQHKFDLGCYSQYAERPAMPANNSYHLIHIVQMRVLALLTANAALQEIADRYQAYYDLPKYKAQLFVFLLKHAIATKLKIKSA